MTTMRKMMNVLFVFVLFVAVAQTANAQNRQKKCENKEVTFIPEPTNKGAQYSLANAAPRRSIYLVQELYNTDCTKFTPDQASRHHGGYFLPIEAKPNRAAAGKFIHDEQIERHKLGKRLSPGFEYLLASVSVEKKPLIKSQPKQAKTRDVFPTLMVKVAPLVVVNPPQPAVAPVAIEESSEEFSKVEVSEMAAQDAARLKALQSSKLGRYVPPIGWDTEEPEGEMLTEAEKKQGLFPTVVFSRLLDPHGSSLWVWTARPGEEVEIPYSIERGLGQTDGLTIATYRSDSYGLTVESYSLAYMKTPYTIKRDNGVYKVRFLYGNSRKKKIIGEGMIIFEHKLDSIAKSP